MDKLLLNLLVWALCFGALFGGTHLMAHLAGWNANDVVGWVSLGAVCTLIARGRK